MLDPSLRQRCGGRSDRLSRVMLQIPRRYVDLGLRAGESVKNQPMTDRKYTGKVACVFDVLTFVCIPLCPVFFKQGPEQLSQACAVRDSCGSERSFLGRFW